jgi:hypothetical protein
VRAKILQAQKTKRGRKATMHDTMLKTQIPASYLRVIGRIRLNGELNESKGTGRLSLDEKRQRV